MKWLRELTALLCVTGFLYLIWKFITTDNITPDVSNVSKLSANDVVRLDVYYESLCPDSIRFITKQLWPTYRKVSDILDIKLITFGKASYKRESNHWMFTCQHGPEECRGNTVQACAINLYPSTSKNLNFVNCVLDSEDQFSSEEKCAENAGMNWSQISNCANGIEGENLLHEMGMKTNSLIPKLYFVPWIIVNDRTSDKILDDALTDLLELVCKNYKGQHLPPACS